MQPTLYLLSPTEGAEAKFCPESALIEGVLAYYPEIRQALDVRRIGFARPRADLIAQLGEDNQGAPVLVFAAGGAAPDNAAAAESGRRFLSGPDAIVTYLADQGLAGRLAS